MVKKHGDGVTPSADGDLQTENQKCAQYVEFTCWNSLWRKTFEFMEWMKTGRGGKAMYGWSDPNLSTRRKVVVQLIPQMLSHSHVLMRGHGG